MTRHTCLGLLRRIAAISALTALLSGSVGVYAGQPSGQELYYTGRWYERHKDYANAYMYYAKAAAADPSKKEYWQRAQALQRRAIEQAKVYPESSGPTKQQLAELDEKQDLTLPDATPAELNEAKRPQPPVELQAVPGRKDFDLRADSKALWEQVTKPYGLDVIFDGDYQASRAQAFHITEADYRTALYALSTATGSFFVPVSEKLLLIVKDTEAKRREVENTVAIAIPIPEPFSVQEAQELGRSVQQLMEIQKFSIDSAQRLVVIRDRVSKVRPAELLFRQLLHARAQVAIEVELLAYNRTRSRQLGTNLPITSIPISPLVKTVTLAGGPLSWAVTIGTATLKALESDGEARTLYRAQLRSVEGMPASMLIGQRYPIQTLGYVGAVTPGQQVYTPPPSFNFEDLGFNVKLTPRVHSMEELSLDLDAEFKLLSGGSLNGIPVISNRKFVTQVRLRFDEAAIISGLITRNDAQLLSGPAGLLSLPVVGALLGEYSTTHDNAEILVVIRPRLLTMPSAELMTKGIWVGSETRPRLPM